MDNTKELHDYFKHPAVYPEVGRNVVFVKDEKEVVAWGRVTVYNRSSLRIQYNKDTMSYFKDDIMVIKIPDFAFFSFFAYFGDPSESLSDIDEKERLSGIRIVDAFDFEWGIAPSVFKNVPGFGIRNKKDELHYVNQVERKQL